MMGGAVCVGRRTVLQGIAVLRAVLFSHGWPDTAPAAISSPSPPIASTARRKVSEHREGAPWPSLHVPRCLALPMSSKRGTRPSALRLSHGAAHRGRSDARLSDHPIACSSQPMTALRCRRNRCGRCALWGYQRSRGVAKAPERALRKGFGNCSRLFDAARVIWAGRASAVSKNSLCAFSVSLRLRVSHVIAANHRQRQ